MFRILLQDDFSITRKVELGYYNGTVDGLLGPGSKQAIREFQKDYDLDVTGALDTPTREKLLALVE